MSTKREFIVTLNGHPFQIVGGMAVNTQGQAVRLEDRPAPQAKKFA